MRYYTQNLVLKTSVRESLLEGAQGTTVLVLVVLLVDASRMFRPGGSVVLRQGNIN